MKTSGMLIFALSCAAALYMSIPAFAEAMPSPVLNDGYDELRVCEYTSHPAVTYKERFEPQLEETAFKTGVPVISGITKQAEGGEIFTIQGENFENSEVFVYHQTNESDGGLCMVQMLSSNGESISARLPECAYGIYMVWVKNSEGTSCPAFINRAELWWTGQTTIEAGTSTNLYGANMTYQNMTEESFAYLLSEDKEAVSLDVTAVNPYRITVNIPEAVTPGEYDITVTNGHGGAYGFSVKKRITITDKPVYSGGINAFSNGNIISVKDYGAVGDGITDDYTAVINAINAADENDILYFPSGTYALSKPVSCKKALYWKGESRDETVICTKDGFDSTKRLVTIEGFPSAVTGITFLCSEQNSITASLLYFRGYGYDPVTDHTNAGSIVEDCCFLSDKTKSGTTGFEAQNLINFQFKNNIVRCAKALFMNTMDRVLINGNVFIGNYMHKEGNGTALNTMWSVNKADFSGNTAYSQDRDNELMEYGDGVINRMIVFQSPYGANTDCYIAENSLDTGGHPNDNSGEQILFENGGGENPGQMLSINGRTMYFENLFNEYEDYFAVLDDNTYHSVSKRSPKSIMIIKGKGAGQVRQIAASCGNSITVSAPWDIEPDETSVMLLACVQTRTVVYKNVIDALKNMQFAQGNASAGVNNYGPMYDSYVADNTFKNVGMGAALFGRYDSLENVYMVSGVIVSGNRIENCCIGLYAPIISGKSITAEEGTEVAGSVLRNNIFKDNIIKNAYSYTNKYPYMGGYGILVGRARLQPTQITEKSFFWDGDWIINQVFENNTVIGAQTSKAYLREYQTNTILKDNNFDSVMADDAIKKRDEIIICDLPALIFAGYDDKKLMEITVDFYNDETKKEYEKAASEKPYTIKIFYWESLESLKPIKREGE